MTTPADLLSNYTMVGNKSLYIIQCTSSTRPSSPLEGQHIYETDTDKTLKNVGTTTSPVWANADINIHNAVADLAACKAIVAAERYDKMLLLIEALGLYRYDSASTTTSDDAGVIRPTDVASDDDAGRWIMVTATPAAHSQAISTITDLQSVLDGKASTVHSQAISTITGLQGELDGKQATLANATTIAKITESGGEPLWDGGAWPGVSESDARNNELKVIKTADQYNSWPVIAKDANGDLLCFYNRGAYHGTDDTSRCVVYKRSTDKGYTWGDEIVILDDAFDTSVFSVGVTDLGTIVLILRHMNAPFSETAVEHVVVRSTDDGATWNAPFVLAALTGLDVTTVGPIIEVPTAGLMAGWHGLSLAGTWTSALIWSSDDGLTWTSQTIVTGPDSTTVPVECRYVYVEAGKILGIGRNQNASGLFQLESSDYGVNWTVAKTNILDHHITPSAILLNDRIIDLLYVDRLNGAVRRRKAGFDDIWNKPLKWTNSKLMTVVAPTGGEVGYPHAINVHRDICLAVFYSGEGTTTGIYGLFYSWNEAINPTKTTGSKTYYVRTDGSNDNDGSANDAAHAFKTIQFAIDQIPTCIKYGHTITIYVADGNYGEDVFITDFYGGGNLNIEGNMVTPANCQTASIWSLGCTLGSFQVKGFDATTITKAGFFAGAVNALQYISNRCIGAGAFDGIRAVSSYVLVTSCTLSNRLHGIRCSLGNVVSTTNAGTGNTNGLTVELGGTIAKNGSQPMGTIAENVNITGLFLPTSTSGNVTYYVRTDGNDSNDGSADDAAHAFLTIQHAIDLIPKHIKYGHTITINVAAGTYAENIVMEKISGAGTFNLLGDTVASTSRTVNSVSVYGCDLGNFIVKGFNTTTTTQPGFLVQASSYVLIYYPNCTAASAQPCVRTVSSFAYVTGGVLSNGGYGIRNSLGTICSDNNGGTGNTVGIQSDLAGTIGKSGTQPGGTTAENAATGGVIR